jgi:hypothetical protein
MKLAPSTKLLLAGFAVVELVIIINAFVITRLAIQAMTP